MSEKKCGFVALIGAPNAGKSTLLNCLVGTKLAIVTPKVQTTRDIIRGIAIEGDCQMVYLDTPGIFSTERNFEKAMVSAAWNGARESDAAVLLVDAERVSRKGLSDAEKTLVKALQDMKNKPRAVWLNKTDKVDKPELLKQVAEVSELSGGAEVFMGSALKNQGTDDLKKWMMSHMPEGEWMFPEDQISDLPMRFIAAEVTREKLFLRLRQELPYGLRVEPEAWEERADGSVKINQIVMVERDAHKKMVLGKQGSQLKEISQAARMSLQKVLDRKVHLFLFVKVVPGWKDKREFLPLGAE
ncbi:MAG: GTPase Era [Rickettsiales bacterium]|nr:GTPase Era [Rickettsiales bacterium]